jgi:hypothetical protein
MQLYSQLAPDQGPSPARLSTFRRDVWPSREVAAKNFQASKFYQAWDPRVLDRWIKHGLYDIPALARQEEPPEVMLTTPRHQEVFSYLRPNYECYGWQNKPINRKTHPDLNPSLASNYPFYRPEISQVFFRLEELRPSVLYIFGGKSEVNTPELRAAKMDHTGVGTGGSGGAPAGRVHSVVLEDIGHLVMMEAVDRTADHSCEWLGSEMNLWRVAERDHEQAWNGKTLMEKQTVDEEWTKMIGGPISKPKKVKL